MAGITPIPETIDLIARYNLGKYADGRKVTIAAEGITALFPNLYTRYQAIGWSAAKIGTLTPFVAAWEDYVWGTNPLPVLANGKPYPCGSRAPFTVGMGKFAVNYPLTWHFGRVTFGGCGYVYPDAASPKGYGGTTLELWKEQWIDDPGFEVIAKDLGTVPHKVGCAIRSTTWGQDGTVGAYHELAGLRDLHIAGNDSTGFKSGRLWCGIVAWDLGSGSQIDNIYGTGLDVGILAVRGTPVDIGKLTLMNGNVAGILSLGGAGATIHVKDYECDDFPVKYMARPFFKADGSVDREAGGAIKVDFGKTETGVTGEQRGPWKGTIIAELDGQFCAEFSMDSLATAMVKVDSAFVLNPKLANGTLQECYLEAKIKRFDCGANIIHTVNGPVYPARVGPYGSAKVEWSTQDGCKVNGVSVAPVAGIGWKRRLGFQRWNGSAWTPSFNHTTGTPEYVYGTGVAPAPTPTPTPTTTPVPPSTTPVFTKSPASVTSGTFTQALNPQPTVSRIVLTGYANPGNTNYTSLAAWGTGASYINVRPDGFYVGEVKCQQTLVGGVLTITLPTPLKLVCLGTANGGGAFTYTATKLELYA